MPLVWWKSNWPWLAVGSTLLLLMILFAPKGGYLNYAADPFDAIRAASMALTAIRFSPARRQH